MSEPKPKLIYKYTHAQAVADGELRMIVWPIKEASLYISKDASKLFENEDDETLAQAAALILLMCAHSGGRFETRIKCQHNGIDYEIANDYEIRDDDKRVMCSTIVAPGER